MAAGILILMLLLTIGFLGTFIASHLKIPHSVLLVLVGVAAGIMVQGRSNEYTVFFASHFPEIILFILLPPLIFEAAYDLDYPSFRRDIFPISALAVVALLVSTVLVGYGLHWIFNLALLPSLTFGALISATDPVAVVALFKEVGAPRRLSTLVEGESLLNDGTAIVLFRLLMLATVGQQLGTHQLGLVGWGILQFLLVTFGGVLVGLVIAFITSFLLRLTVTSAAAQLGLTVVAAYTSFLAADHFFQVSGVIATMTVGLYLGRRARLELNADALSGMRHVWQFLALTANILVFFAVGLIVDPGQVIQSLHFIPLTLAIVYGARTFSVLTTTLFVEKLGVAKPIGLAYQTVLIWGGLRGGLALGLVLTLPENFPHKKLFVALAVSVVFATLFINALSTKRVLSLLKLDKLTATEMSFFSKTVELVRDAVFQPLIAASQKGALSGQLVQEQRKKFTSAVESFLSRPLPSDIQSTVLDKSVDVGFKTSSMILRERNYYDLRLQEGALSKEGYLELVASVSRRLESFGVGGVAALQNQQLEFPEHLPFSEQLWGIFGRQQSLLLHRLTIRLETLLHLRFAIEESVADISDDTTLEINKRWKESVDSHIQDFYQIYPHYAAIVQAQFISNATRARSEKSLRALFDIGIISPSVFAKANAAFTEVYRTSFYEAQQLVRPSAVYLLARVPLFNLLPRVALRTLADSMKSRVLHSDQILCKSGEMADSMFLVLAGILETKDSVAPEPHGKTRLLTGDYTEVKYLLKAQPRDRTLVSTGTTEVLELKQNHFNRVLDEYPTLRNQIFSQS